MMAFGGSIFGGNQAEEANKNRIDQRSMALWNAKQYYDYFPKILSTLSGMVDNAPQWQQGLGDLAASDISRNSQQATASALAGFNRSGMLGSGGMGRALAGINRSSSEALGRSRLGYAQAGDERQRAILGALAGLVSGLGGQANSNFQGLAQSWQQASDDALGNITNLGVGIGGLFAGGKKATQPTPPTVYQTPDQQILGVLNGLVPNTGYGADPYGNELSVYLGPYAR